MAESITNQHEPSSNVSSIVNSSTITEEKPKKEAKIYNWTRLLRPWKWKRKKKSEKFSKTAATLERKISVRSTREDLIKRGLISEVDPPETVNEQPDDENKNIDNSENGQIKVSPNLSDQLEDVTINKGNISNEPSKFNQSQESNQLNHITPPQPLKRTSLRDTDKSDANRFESQSTSENKSESSNSNSIKKPVAAKRTKKNIFISDENITSSPPKPPPKPPKSTLPVSDSEDNTNDNQKTEVIFASDIEVIPSVVAEEIITSSNFKDDQVSEISEKGKAVVDSDSESSIVYCDNSDEEDEDVPTGGLGSKVARKDTLALRLSNRSTVETTSNDRTSVKRNISRHLSQRPTKLELQERNILPNETAEERLKEREKVKRQLTRKLSMRPTVQELIERKVLHWHEYVEVYEVHHYDRRGDKPWTRLTASDKASIRKELNEFKANEMEVHEESKKFTRFHRP